MYIFELFYKIFENMKTPPKKEEKVEYPVCEHIFLPVDSTKKILACSKCGIIKKIKS